MAALHAVDQEGVEPIPRTFQLARERVRVATERDRGSIAAGVACLVFVHWLVGLFWLELAIALLAVEHTVGLRYFALADASRSRKHPWPPSNLWTAQIFGAAILGLAIAYVGIRTQEPLAVLAAMMAILAGYLLWTLPLLKRRQQQELSGC